MEKMMEMMIKAMGLDVGQVKENVTQAAIIFKSMAEQLNRVEQKIDLLLKEKPIDSPVINKTDISTLN